MALTSESTVRREVAPACHAASQTFGHWLLERELGRGGMGSVWLARHAALGLRAAVKILRPDLAGSPEHAQRFLDEARTGAMLRHPNVVQVFDLFLLADGRPCFVMEYVEGRTLEDVAGNAPMEPERARALLLQLAGALGEAHFRGLVHRDVKAQNVMVEVGRDGSEFVKLLDFGIARRSFQDGGLTAPGTSLGTPHYMAPEQAVGGQVDFRADVYALGVLAHRLLNGRVPFEGSVSEVLAQQVQAEPPPLVAGSEALRRVVRRAMAKRPADRFDTAGEFARALREAPATDEAAEDGPEVLVARGRVELRYAAAERLHASVGHGLVRRRLFVRSERLPSTPEIDLVADAPGAEPVIVPARVVASFDGEDAERFGITPGFALELDTAALDPAPAREVPAVLPGGRRTRAERYRRRFAVSFGPPGALQNAGFTTNVSATGLAVSTHKPQPVGTRLSLTFTHVDRGPKVQGFVVWAKAPAARGGNGLMGVRIDGADEGYFQLLLEAAKAAAGEKGAGAEKAPGPAEKRADHQVPQVMVVEDNRDIRLLLHDAFRGEGFEVLLCADGGLALAAMERLRRPSAVVLDLTMPLVSGWKVFEALKASPGHRDLPVVVLSAHPDARQLAGAHVVPKPFELDALTKLVRRLVVAP